MKSILNVLKYIFFTCAIVYFILEIIIFVKNPNEDFNSYIQRIGPGIWMLLAGLIFHHLKNNVKKFFGEKHV